MKITSEDIDREIIFIRNNLYLPKEVVMMEEIATNSKELDSMIEAILIVHETVSNSIYDTVMNSLLQGIKIGQRIAQNKIEINQLEAICGIVEDGDH